MEKDTATPAKPLGYGGLVNMGLTCYANSVIQCLRHCERIPWIFKGGRYSTLFEKDPRPRRALQQDLTKAFAEVIDMLGRCKRGQSVRPGEFWARLLPTVENGIYEHFAIKAPHDSHEFFLFVLETIHEAMAQDVEMRILRPPPQTPQDHLVHGALQSWQREFSKEYSPFVDLFFGLTHWRTTCQACGNVSHRWESFNSLKGVVPKGGLGAEPTSLFSMLEAEMAPEIVQGYQCDGCRAKTAAERKVRLWRLPQTLVIVLKRFTADGRKIHTRMSDIPADGVLDFTPLFSQDSPEREGVLRYSIRAIVDHHGGANGGHYTAQCKGLADGTWLIYDDEGVSDLPGGKNVPFVGDSTYMLFLERAA